MLSTQRNQLTDAIKPLDHQVNRDDHTPLPDARACCYIISASRGRGKTSLLLNLLQTPKKKGGLKKRFDNIFLFSPTARSDTKMGKLVRELEKEDKFYEVFDNESSEQVIERIKEFHTENPESRNCIIFDDCMADLPKSFEKTGGLNRFIIQTRHFNCWCIFLIQRYVGVSRLIRSQADLISFFKTDNTKELQALIDDVNMDKQALQTLYEFATEKPNDFLHINLLNRTFYKKFDPIIIDKK